ncbi:5-formyltetrahydrofolate cyclo-ligase [Rhodococcus kronopolitis]|uniref:5-formyltetrahydrofolate cyclo-ligase n=1 Tax=Rhodococcus kronopolitis TaxID=1460226 RepID=A0ABV9FMQ6_9NOCA
MTAPQHRTKNEWRERILAERRAVDAVVRAAEALAVTETALALAGSGTVCAFVPVGTEPGSTELLVSLRAAGVRVLLPVAREPGPLHWATFESLETLVPARFGLREPAPPHLPPRAVADAAVVLVPALAVDRRGVRLGRGAGFYDRTLSLAGPNAKLVAVVRDTELVDVLPEDPHDVRMGWALTPGGGLQQLGRPS